MTTGTLKKCCCNYPSQSDNLNALFQAIKHTLTEHFAEKTRSVRRRTYNSIGISEPSGVSRGHLWRHKLLIVFGLPATWRSLRCLTWCIHIWMLCTFWRYSTLVIKRDSPSYPFLDSRQCDSRKGLCIEAKHQQPRSVMFVQAPTWLLFLVFFNLYWFGSNIHRWVTVILFICISNDWRC